MNRRGQGNVWVRVSLAAIVLLLLSMPVLAVESIEEVQAAKAVPLDDAAAVIERESANTLLSMRLRATDIRDALRLVARQGGVNIVVSEGVKGKVTLELDNATVGQALDAIVNANGYVHHREGNIILVSTPAEVTERRSLKFGAVDEADQTEVRLFQLKYIDARNLSVILAPMLTSVGKLAVMPTGEESIGAPGAVSSSDDTVQIGGTRGSSSEGRPARADTLVVVDVPKRLKEIARHIEGLDVKPRQVLIEARFVEITLNGDFRLGIDWNAVIRAAGAAVPHTFPFGSSKLGEFNPRTSSFSSSTSGSSTSTTSTSTTGASGLAERGSGVFPPATATVTDGETSGLFTFGTLDFSAFTAVLQMIDEKSEVNQVSNPRILVNERKTATILVGERFPIFSGGVTDFGTTTEDLARFEPIGVQLVVTPSILDDGKVELIIRPAISSLGSTVTGTTGLTAPRINTRRVDTTVTVTDGQTIVLGGLVSERTEDVISRVPFLSSIPLLGNLFTNKSKRTDKVELAIFLTTRVIDGATPTEKERNLFERHDPDGNKPDAAMPHRSKLDFTPAKAAY